MGNMNASNMANSAIRGEGGEEGGGGGVALDNVGWHLICAKKQRKGFGGGSSYFG